MGIFSRFKNKGEFNLSKSDFQSEGEDYEVLSVKFSEGFFKKFPQAKKKKNYTGKFTLGLNSGDIHLFGDKVKLTYDPSEIEINENKFIEQINKKLNWISNNRTAIYNGIAEKLVTIKNESWLEENETKVSKTEFIKRLQLISINFLGDSNSELTFDNGDLFWGHQIIAHLSSKNDLTSANISG